MNKQTWQAYDHVVTDEARDGSSSTTTTTTTWVRQTSVGVIVLLTLETDRQSSNAECDRHISVAGPDVADDGSGDLVFVRTDEDGCHGINFDGDPDFDAAEAKKPIVTTERWSGAGDGYLKK